MQLVSTDDGDYYVTIKDQEGNDFTDFVVDFDGDIKIEICIPQIKGALFKTLLERHPEMREELELIVNEIQLKNEIP